MKNPTCPTFRDDDLTGLAAGDLPRRRAARLRHHLRDCPTCASALGEIENVFAQSRAILAQPSGDLHSRTWAQIETLGAFPSTLRYRRTRPAVLFSIGASTAALGGVAAALLLAPGTTLRPTVAFADVARVMQHTQSVAYETNTTSFLGKSVRAEHVMTSLRLNPPEAMVRTDGPALWVMRVTPKATYQHFRRENQRPEYIISPPTSPGLLHRLIQSKLFFTPHTAPIGLVAGWSPPRTVTVEGKKLLRFDRTVDMGLSANPVRVKNARTAARHQTVWADPTTLHYIREEDIFTDASGVLQTRTISSGYRYDSPPTPFMEDEPRVGESVALNGGQMPVGAAMKETRDAVALIQKASQAWEHGDWQTFQITCDGGEPDWDHPITAATHQPLNAEFDEKTWKRIVESRRYLPQGSVRSVTAAAYYAFTRHKESDHLPTKLPPNVYVAKTANVWFFLKHTSDAGLRIFRIVITGGGPPRRY